MVTEFGRQPWIIQGYMRVAEGVTPHGGVPLVFGTFFLVYVALTWGLFRLLANPRRTRAGGNA